MYTLYHKRIPKTIPKDSIDGHGTSTGEKIHTIIPFLTYCYSKESHTYVLPLKASSVCLLKLQIYTLSPKL